MNINHNVKINIPQIMASASKTENPARKGVRWPLALSYAARQLDCTPQHLGRVLNNQAPSYGIREGYEQLVKIYGSTATAARGPRRKRS